MAKDPTPQTMRHEGNVCIGTGVGVGALGAAAATVLGAACPICFIAAPLLIGLGVRERMRACRKETSEENNQKSATAEPEKPGTAS